VFVRPLPPPEQQKEDIKASEELIKASEENVSGLKKEEKQLVVELAKISVPFFPFLGVTFFPHLFFSLFLGCVR